MLLSAIGFEHVYWAERRRQWSASRWHCVKVLDGHQGRTFSSFNTVKFELPALAIKPRYRNKGQFLDS